MSKAEAGFGPLTYPFQPTGEDAHASADYVTVREIDMKMTGNRLVFYFSRGADIYLRGHPDSIEEIVDKVAQRKFAFSQKQPKLDPPFSSSLSLFNENRSYVIYTLAEGWNWQFARRGYPITIATAAKGSYYNANRVDASGYRNGDRGSDLADLRDGCMVAHFIADPLDANGDPMNHEDAINIHVDLVYEDLDATRYIPLIIDPDIRYPGGSNIEGEP